MCRNYADSLANGGAEPTRSVGDITHDGLDELGIEFESAPEHSSSLHASEVFGEFRITNLPYKPTLRNNTSPDFLFLSTQLLTAVSAT